MSPIIFPDKRADSGTNESIILFLLRVGRTHRAFTYLKGLENSRGLEGGVLESVVASPIE